MKGVECDEQGSDHLFGEEASHFLFLIELKYEY